LVREDRPVIPTESPCPWCEFGVAVPCRWHDDGTEYRCRDCGGRHTRKVGSEDAFAFFPADIYAAFDPSVKPLELEDDADPDAGVP
jgi:hypothetical protein